MKFKTRPKVALLVETSRSYGRDLLRGVTRFVRTRNNWSLLHQEMTIDSVAPEWIEESAIAGVIARVDRPHNSVTAESARSDCGRTVPPPVSGRSAGRNR